MPKASFSAKVLKWFDQHGRKDLPWQLNPSPYTIWLSEIMLQQTQVNTVIPYFQRFIEHFPEVEDLAKAELDQVLWLWSGLGYYARARNLFKTAKLIVDDYQGKFPSTVEELIQLPGIGRSTAGAIVASAFEKKASILDGNVKRVLCRYHAINNWPGAKETQAQLWEITERYTPSKRVRDYTQAIMDLGAMICTRAAPHCQQCPLRADCLAYRQNAIKLYPVAKPKKTLPIKKTQMLIIENSQHEILLYKRPASGIWGGLWSLPEITEEIGIENWCQQQLALTILDLKKLPAFRHTFSHYHLDIEPYYLNSTLSYKIMDSSDWFWYKRKELGTLGMAAPIKQLLAPFLHDR